MRIRRTEIAALGIVAGLLSLVPAWPALPYGTVLAVRVERLTDTNGDLDGQLDTNESAELVLSISNKSSEPARDFHLRISPLGGRIDALSPAVFRVALLAPGATLTLPAIQIHASAAADRGGPAVNCLNPGPGGTCSNFVAVPGGCASDVACRVDASGAFSASIGIDVVGLSTGIYGQWPYFLQVPVAVPAALVFDLDLDSSHPAQGTTTYAEEFDAGGFGSFLPVPLDAQIASNAASDGARCQYSDPDFPNGSSYGNTECYLGHQAGQSPPNDWHSHSNSAPDGGRAFTGTRSLHYGRHMSGLDTYPLSQMDAIRSRTPVNLAARVCENDPAPDPRACAGAGDCAAVGGGACVPARPGLSFKQQIALVDYRCLHPQFGQAYDRAVVAAQQDGTGIWHKLYPYVNIYDVAGSDDLSNCTFDPTDDGNTEDDFFAPGDPERLYGPSSSCFPEFVFASVGATAGPFQAASVGRASDGPGLQGSLGPGTWVESRFDLSRFRGRSIRIRFLVTTLKISDYVTWNDLMMWNPTETCDDGWWIDDVQMSETLGSTTPTVTADAHDNSALPGAIDSDGDGRPDDFDCAPLDAGAFSPLPEVLSLSALNELVFSWEPAFPSAGSGTVYDVARGKLGEWPVGSGANEACAASGTATAGIADAQAPDLGSGFWYLVRARNVCGAGIYGYDSEGGVRTTSACP